MGIRGRGPGYRDRSGADRGDLSDRLRVSSSSGSYPEARSETGPADGRPAVRPWGFPATLNLALPSLLISALNGILAAFSETYVLILGVYYKLQTFLYLPASGVVQGMRPIIGYNYGAGQHKRVRSIYRARADYEPPDYGPGNRDLPGGAGNISWDCFPTARRLFGRELWPCGSICAGFVVSAVSVTASGALEGPGKGRRLPGDLPVPLCSGNYSGWPSLLSRFFGAEGVWNAFWVTEVFSSAAAWAVYRRTLRKKRSSLRVFEIFCWNQRQNAV